MNDLYLVTGACGHVGNTLVKRLAADGCRVRALALGNEDRSSLDGTGAQIVTGDVRDKASLSAFFDNSGYGKVYCIHCAGIVSISSVHDPNVYDVNVNGTKNIVEMCIERGVSRLVYVSSVHAIPEKPDDRTITEVNSFSAGQVVGLYAKTKSEATQAVLDASARGLDAVVVHPSGIIGPNDYGTGHLTQLVMDYLNGSLSACVKGGYDFVDVRDVVDGIVAAIDKGRSGECYILSNRYYGISEVLETLHSITGSKRVRVVLPGWFVKAVAPLAELYYKLRRAKPLFTRYSLHTLFSNSNFSHAKANRELGYAPRDLKTSLSDTVKFLAESGRIKRRAANGALS